MLEITASENVTRSKHVCVLCWEYVCLLSQKQQHQLNFFKLGGRGGGGGNLLHQEKPANAKFSIYILAFIIIKKFFSK